MAVSFKEKRKLQGNLKAIYASLVGDVGFKEKRKLQADLKETYAKLNADVDVDVDVDVDSDDYQLPTGYTKLAPIEFTDLLLRADGEGAGLPLLKKAAIEYVEANEDILVA